MSEGEKTTVLWMVTTVPAVGMESRVVAVCTDLGVARELVLGNDLDIHDRSYKYVVVEPVRANCAYGGRVMRDAIWFEWQGDHDDGSYVECPKPEKFKRIVMFWS